MPQKQQYQVVADKMSVGYHPDDQICHEVLFGDANLVMGYLFCSKEMASWLQEQLNK